MNFNQVRCLYAISGDQWLCPAFTDIDTCYVQLIPVARAVGAE